MKQALASATTTRRSGGRTSRTAKIEPRQVQTAEEPPVEVRIQVEAYALYEARGCVDGHDLDDWMTAEEAVARGVQGARSSTSGTDH